MPVDGEMIGKNLIVIPSVESLLADLELFVDHPRCTTIFYAQDLER
jgi:hypothetical protein